MKGYTMETYRYTIVIEPDEGGFHAFVPSLPGCHSYGKTLDEARLNIKEAISLHLDCMREDGESIPKSMRKIDILKREWDTGGILNAAGVSRVAGIKPATLRKRGERNVEMKPREMEAILHKLRMLVQELENQRGVK
jgi:predicted RNase H-like HicB family nuclease